MAQSSRPSLVSIASAYVSDESNVVCVLHACTYAQACVHDLCTVIEGWEAWILHTSGANRRRIINALTRTSLKQTLFLVVGVGLTLLHWIRLVFGSFLFLLFFFFSCERLSFGKYSIREIVRRHFVSYCLIYCFLLLILVWLRFVLNWFDVGFFPFFFARYNFSFRNIRNENFVWNLKSRCQFQIWWNLEALLRRMDRWNFLFLQSFDIWNLWIY